MSNALIIGFIAAGVSAATVIGLEVSGVKKAIVGSESSTLALAGDEENDPEALKQRIVELEEQIESLNNSVATDAEADGLRRDLKKVEDIARDAYSLASSGTAGGGEYAATESSETTDIEVLVNDALDKRLAEEKAAAEAEKKKKQEEHKAKTREQFLERTTKTFNDLKDKQGLTESTVAQAIQYVMLGYDNTVAYNDDIKVRREQGQTITEEEIKTERERIKTETNTALEMLFSKDQWVEVSKAVERIPRDMGDNRGNETPRASADSPRAKPKGDGGARR
ncbi:MAG: hypothetical protein L6Q71_06125 [Planctomycetes bacterium]|nr:hypothetical protein [Planctomycetota bacterium]NUQ33770.1 hypothetical protein [Planctomycetaceae bacterium]